MQQNKIRKANEICFAKQNDGNERSAKRKKGFGSNSNDTCEKQRTQRL